MSRRDRTTGKPKHRPRAASERERRAGGLSWSPNYTRYAILGAAGVLLIFVLGMVGYRWYDENIGKPRDVILRVNDESFTLGYFTDRLGQFAVANPQLSRGFIEPALLTKLEEEVVMIEMAEAQGYDLSDQAVTDYIAEDLGVEPGGSGSTFDSLYRDALRRTGLDDGDYRRLSKGALAESLLIEDIQEGISDTGETLTLRVVILRDEESAAAIRERIEDGEDMAVIAREESLDLNSRGEDGMLPPAPRLLLPENVQPAVQDADEGDLVGPVQVQNGWWVARVEEIDPEGDILEEDQQQLADLQLQQLLDEAREDVEAERSLGPDQISWAYRNLTIPGGN